MLDTIWDLHYSCLATREETARDLYIDLSQNVCQGNWSDGHLATALTSMDVYSYGEDRRFLPQDYFNMHGYPRLDLRGVKAHHCREMAGESFALPVTTVLAVGLLLHITDDGLWETKSN